MVYQLVTSVGKNCMYETNIHFLLNVTFKKEVAVAKSIPTSISREAGFICEVHVEFKEYFHKQFRIKM